MGRLSTQVICFKLIGKKIMTLSRPINCLTWPINLCLSVPENHSTLSTETTTNDDDHYDVYIGTTLGILILAVCVTGAIMFVKKKIG